MNRFKVFSLYVKYETASYEKNVRVQVDYKKVVQPENDILICVVVHVIG